MLGQNATTCKPIITLPASDNELIRMLHFSVVLAPKQLKRLVLVAVCHWLSPPLGADMGVSNISNIAPKTNEALKTQKARHVSGTSAVLELSIARFSQRKKLLTFTADLQHV